MISNEIHLVHQMMVPVRSEPRDPAEMVTQLLFGDVVEVLETDRQWRRIRSHQDQYEGWIDHKMIVSLPEGWLAEVAHWEFINQAAIALDCEVNGRAFPLQLSYGCRIPVLHGQVTADCRHLDLGHWQLRIPRSCTQPVFAATPTNLIAVSDQYRGAPYLWGGKCLWSIDCSGLTQVIFAQCGRLLPRDASQQVKTGHEVAYGEHLPGDLAFFHNDKGKVTHVGLVLENNLVRHASGYVRDDLLTAEGIVIKSSQTLTHILCSIKRIL